MPSKPFGSRLSRKRTTTGLRPDRYHPANLRYNHLRLIIAIRHAQGNELELRKKIAQISGQELSGISRTRKHVVYVDGKRLYIDFSEGLKEIESTHEYVWYAVVNHQLIDIFASDYKVTVMPQYHLRFKEFDFNNREDSVKYCIPDFCVAKYRIKRTPGLSVLDYRVLLIVESKMSSSGPQDFKNLSRSAWDQVRKQAGILFSQRPDQGCVGVMITIGVSWAFEILQKETALYPAKDEHAYSPPDSSPSSASDESGEDEVLDDFMQTTRDSIPRLLPRNRMPRNRTPQNRELRDREASPNFPTVFYTFGTVESDAHLRVVRKTLLELSRKLDPPTDWVIILPCSCSLSPTSKQIPLLHVVYFHHSS